MPLFKVGPRLNHQQANLPGSDTATHFRNGRVVDLTPEQVEHIRYNEPALFANLTLHPDPYVNPRTRRVLAAAHARAEEEAKPPAPEPKAKQLQGSKRARKQKSAKVEPERVSSFRSPK